MPTTSTHGNGHEKSTVEKLPGFLLERLHESWAGVFNKTCFQKLDAGKLATFFHGDESDYRLPTNVYFGLESLKLLFDWSDEELLSNFHFDLRVAFALGIESLGEVYITPTVLSLKRKQVLNMTQNIPLTIAKVGISYQITEKEIAAMKTNTKYQTLDFSEILEHLRKMERLENYVRILNNFYSDLPMEEQLWYYPNVQEYVSDDVPKMLAGIKASEVDLEIKKVLALLYYFNIIYYSNESVNALPSFLNIRKLLFAEFNIPRNGKAKHISST